MLRATEEQMARRERLAKLLEKVPERFFDMRNWWKDSVGETIAGAGYGRVKRVVDRLSDLLYGRKKPRPFCQTSACVGGWAAVLWPTVMEGGRFGTRRFQELLGLSFSQYYSLCCEPHYGTAKEKAKQLRRIGRSRPNAG